MRAGSPLRRSARGRMSHLCLASASAARTIHARRSCTPRNTTRFGATTETGVCYRRGVCRACVSHIPPLHVRAYTVRWPRRCATMRRWPRLDRCGPRRCGLRRRCRAVVGSARPAWRPAQPAQGALHARRRRSATSGIRNHSHCSHRCPVAKAGWMLSLLEIYRALPRAQILPGPCAGVKLLSRGRSHRRFRKGSSWTAGVSLTPMRCMRVCCTYSLLGIGTLVLSRHRRRPSARRRRQRQSCRLLRNRSRARLGRGHGRRQSASRRPPPHEATAVSKQSTLPCRASCPWLATAMRQRQWQAAAQQVQKEGRQRRPPLPTARAVQRGASRRARQLAARRRPATRRLQAADAVNSSSSSTDNSNKNSKSSVHCAIAASFSRPRLSIRRLSSPTKKKCAA